MQVHEPNELASIGLCIQRFSETPKSFPLYICSYSFASKFFEYDWREERIPGGRNKTYINQVFGAKIPNDQTAELNRQGDHGRLQMFGSIQRTKSSNLGNQALGASTACEAKGADEI
jgi:hypothetical protein